MNVPEMYTVTQEFDRTRVQDIAKTVEAELAGLGLHEIVKGGRVAITAGSRGIDNIAIILKHVAQFFSALGADPFIFPAMGSHGGATARGQEDVLAHLGIMEPEVAVPILSSMDVAKIGQTIDGVPVFIDKQAALADHVVVVNRIKSHTKFKAPIESGLMKMMAIGMGKQQGADYYHRAAVQYTFPKIIVDAARLVIQKTPVLCGIGIVENGFGQTAKIKTLKPAAIEEGEKVLLKYYKQMAARLPFDDIDLLIIDEIGKEISGVGMDPNVTGRNRDLSGVFPHPTHVKRVFVRDLTADTNGNANGIGLADITTTRLVNKIDYKATYRNAITAISLEKAAVPMHVDTDQEAVDIALGSIGLIPGKESRVVWIRDTMKLDRVMVSTAYGAEIDKRSDLKILAGPVPMQFDADGNLVPPRI